MTNNAHEAQSNTGSASGPKTPNTSDGDFKTWINHPKSVARLQILVIVLGIFVVAGFFTVIGRIAYLTLYQNTAATAVTTSTAATSTPVVNVPPANAAGELAVEIPPGATVISIQAMSDGSVMVHFKDTRGDGIMVFENTTGALIRKWRFLPAAP